MRSLLYFFQTLAGHKKGQKYEFQFDRVFAPGSSQVVVFEEISQLVQVGIKWVQFSNLTQDVNKSRKNLEMRKIRFFSKPAHENLIQYDEEW